MGITSRRERSAEPAISPGRRWRQAARRFVPEVALVAAALLWWPVGFWGLQPWLHLPIHAQTGDVLLLGGIAAAAAVALLVRAPWLRFAVVVLFSGLGWLLSAPARDSAPDERQSLAILLAVAGIAGTVIGARGQRGVLGAATVLAVVAGLSPATWPHGAPLAVALALPFAVASWQRVAPTMLSIARVLLTWLLFAVLADALRHGWLVLHPHMHAGSRRNEVSLVVQAAWSFLRSQWLTTAQQLLSATVGWFWVAAGLAVLVAGARAVTSGARRRPPADSSSPRRS